MLYKVQVHCIFYDLETSDRNPVGQILNFCFMAVDESLTVWSECHGDIRLSRLQLPAAEAIMANRIDVLEHQKYARWSEPQAMRAIIAWIGDVLSQAKGKVALLGYNSTRFDLPYLRTSLIRNGFNPYFGGNLVYRDLLHAARKLSIVCDSFPRFPRQEEEDVGQGARLSLSLENLAQRLGILSGSQTHTARDDVALTLELARTLRDRFNFDAVSYQAYEAPNFETDSARRPLGWAVEPEYDLGAGQPFRRVPMFHLHSNYRYTLWVDLERYAAGAGRQSIKWYNRGGSFLYYGGSDGFGEEWSKLAKKAEKEFAGITADNFFPPSSCDVEQDIYRIDMQQVEALHAAIWKQDLRLLSRIRNRDVRILYRRFELANFEGDLAEIEDSSPHARKRELLRQYAFYRYGGKLQLAKCLDPQAPARESDYHPTYSQMLCSLESAAREASEQDAAVLKALETYYRSSEIYRICGGELP